MEEHGTVCAGGCCLLASVNPADLQRPRLMEESLSQTVGEFKNPLTSAETIGATFEMCKKQKRKSTTTIQAEANSLAVCYYIRQWNYSTGALV